MRRAYRFVEPEGMIEVTVGDTQFRLPLAPGILKHRNLADLAVLLAEPAVARKYTIEALRVGPWSVVRAFPPAWLRECLESAPIGDSRRAAIEFLLDARDRHARSGAAGS